MSRSQAWWRAGVMLVGVASAGTSGTAFGAAQAPLGAEHAGGTPRGWFKDSRGELALARARGDTSVRLAIAAHAGRVADVARAVVGLGGTVEVRNDAVGYLRVRLPLDQAAAAAVIPGVQVADVSVVNTRPRAYYGSTPGNGAEDEFPRTASAGGTVRPTPGGLPLPAGDSLPWPPPPSRYPFEHPYSPLADLGAADWRAIHPTWDGRGVTIADLEATPDLLAPELATGLTLDGHPVPKFVDVLTVADPDADSSANPSTSMWLRMRDTVVARGGHLRWHEREYVAPHDGIFRIDAVNERLWTSAWRAGDLNRDGNPPGSDSLFAVLWDERANVVWVDTEQKGDFQRQRPLTDYVVRNDIGEFGHDDPATPVRESTAFTVQTDRVHHRVALNVGLGSHASMVQGAAAGARGSRGHYDGVAPGARLVSIDYGPGSAASFCEALIRAFEDRRIDIVVFEPDVDVADYTYVLRDGGFVSSVIASRLLARYPKPLLVPGGNVPGLGRVTETASALGAIGVGAYQSAESYRVNDGILAASADNLHVVGSGGPGGDGALKPDLLAPSEVLSSNPGYVAGEGLSGLFELPPGYTIGGGTSTATPVAAGAVALLLSAAKQTGLGYNASHVRRAVLMTTRYLHGIPAYEQGHGLLQVGAAWEALNHRAHNRDTSLSWGIRVQTPVRTAVGAWFAVPYEGQGLYEMDWVPGQRAERVLTLSRSAGPRGPTTLATRWRGNDGTFASPSQVVLPRGKSASFSVIVAPTTSGAHSAQLELVAPSTGTVVQRISCVIVVPDTFPALSYRLAWQDSVPRPGRRNLFVRVPAGVGALALNFSRVTGSFFLVLRRPDGRHINLPRVDTSGALRQVANPEAGVWELSMIDNFRTAFKDQTPGAPLASVRFTLEASLAQATIEPVRDSVTGRIGRAAARNVLAAIRAALTTQPLASGTSSRDCLERGRQRVYSIDVPAGSPLLLARVAPVGVPDADLDLYLFDCTKGRCMPAADAADTGPLATIAYAHPAAGTWKVVVDAAVPGLSRPGQRGARQPVPGDTSTAPVPYAFQQLAIDPALGTTSVADVPSDRVSGAVWSAPAHVWQAQPDSAGRRLFAVFAVEDERRESNDEQSAAEVDRVPLAWTAVPIVPRTEGSTTN